MTELVFDIETDGLDPTVAHCMTKSVQNSDSNRRQTSTDHKNQTRSFGRCIVGLSGNESGGPDVRSDCGEQDENVAGHANWSWCG